jgi:hypothetical protein
LITCNSAWPIRASLGRLGVQLFYTRELGDTKITSMAVVREAGAPPVTVFTNEYDSAGRVIRQTLADGSIFDIEYSKAWFGGRPNVKVTEPSGRVLEISRASDYNCIVHTSPIRFLRLPEIRFRPGDGGMGTAPTYRLHVPRPVTESVIACVAE